MELIGVEFERDLGLAYHNWGLYSRVVGVDFEPDTDALS